MKEMNADRFYRLFKGNFKPTKNTNIKKAYSKYAKTLSMGQWTGLMGEFLFDMMDQKYFDRNDFTSEIRIPGGRPDYKWEKKGYSIFIEHENDKKDVVRKEVKNLLNSDGDLRVLITYVEDPEEREDLVDEILDQLKNKKEGKNFEFLLIIGTDEQMVNYHTWEAHRFHPTFEVEALD